MPTRVHLVSIYEPYRGPVEVRVKDVRGPVVLALSSFDPADWVIELGKDVVLKEVILQGGPRRASSVQGLPPGVPLWSEVIGASSRNGDLGYRLAVHYVRQRYGVEPASYQVEYRGRQFEIE